MTTLPVVANPFETFLDLKGAGINNGSVYIGVEGQDPETNPVAVFWDAAGLIPASQPLSLIGGYLRRAGSPARVYTLANYSIRVRDRSGAQVFYEPTGIPNVVDPTMTFFTNVSGTGDRVYFFVGGAIPADMPAETVLLSPGATITLPEAVDIDWAIEVSRNGVIQIPPLFSVAGTVLTFSEPLVAGERGFVILNGGISSSFPGSVTFGRQVVLADSTEEFYAAAGPVTQPNSGHAQTQDGGKVNRMNDRLFVGYATANDGAFPNVAKDWLTTYQQSTGLANGSIVSARAAVLDDKLGFGLVGGARSLNFSASGQSCIGAAGFAVNNHLTLDTEAWGGYFEGHRDNDTVGATYGVEIDTRNKGALQTAQPYVQNAKGTYGLQIAHGAGVPGALTFDATAAINIQDNPKKFEKGIIFGSNAIVGTDGLTGTGVAIAMAKGHVQAWYNSLGQQTATITSDITTSSHRTGIIFNEVGCVITDAAGSALLTVSYGGQIVLPVSNVPNFANDAAAAAGGIIVGGCYRNGSALQIRVS